MLPSSNLHTHTTFSDGRDAAEAVVGAALRLGFHTLGFSDHGHADYDDCSMSLAAEARYRAEIARLQKKYADRLNILLGYEHDWLSPYDPSPYAYVIESVHYVPAEGGLACVDASRERLLTDIDRYFGGDPYAFCRAYFRTVAESCAGGAQILGHMELVMKFNEGRDIFDDADPRYLKCALEAADCAADSGMLVEVNTGAIAKGCRTQPYPGPAILRRLAERRARIIFSSDCHNLSFLDCAFPECAALARACGFKTAFEARGDAFVEYPLDDKGR